MSDRDELRRLALGTLLASFPGAEVPSWLWRAADAGLGGICLYGSNRGADVGAVAAGLHAVRPDLVVALDEEGGDVTRLEDATGSSVPGNAALGAVDDVDLTRGVGRALGAVLRASGVDLDLAPCADVNSDPDNPVIGVRAFGADPALVARHVVAFTSGLQDAGVAACAKHFPGHGATAVDSHVAVPAVAAPADVLRDRELVPFRAALAAGVRAVMPGHLLVPAVDPERPATVSRRIVTDLLRGELGFIGLVVTDALDMDGAGGHAAIPATVPAALAAGADLCCLGPDNDEALVEACVDAVVTAVVGGELAVERLADAASRVAAVRRPPMPPTVLATNVPAGPAMVSQEPSQEPAHEPAHEPGGHDTARAALAAIGFEAAVRALRIDGALPEPSLLAGAHVVELDRPANIAAGMVPWGVGAPVRAIDPMATVARVPEGDDRAVASALVAAADRPLVVVVRDAHRRPAQAAALRTLAAARPDAVVVDVGWPMPAADRPAVATWITTYGASRASGEAVARLLAGAPAAAPAASSGRTSRG